MSETLMTNSGDAELGIERGREAREERGGKSTTSGKRGDGRLIAHKSCILRPIASASSHWRSGEGRILTWPVKNRHSAANNPLAVSGIHVGRALNLVLDTEEDETRRSRDQRVTRRSRDYCCGVRRHSRSFACLVFSCPAANCDVSTQARI
ncbi:hypothetical protein BJX76DRAFT_21155 [Aspergillus varians]